MASIECIVMAGGRGTRLGAPEKPMVEVCGEPMIVRVLRQLASVCGRIIVVYSRFTPSVGELCRSPPVPVECVRGWGSYVEDLKAALSLASPPVLVAPADMPFLNAYRLEDFMAKALLDPNPIVNLSARGRGPTGLSLFKEAWGSWSTVEDGGCWTLDVDTPEDLEKARSLCGSCI